MFQWFSVVWHFLNYIVYVYITTINRYAILAISCLSLVYSDTKEKPDDSQAGSGVIRRVVSSVIFTWIYVHLFRSTWALVIVSWESVRLNLKTCVFDWISVTFGASCSKLVDSRTVYVNCYRVNCVPQPLLHLLTVVATITIFPLFLEHKHLSHLCHALPLIHVSPSAPPPPQFSSTPLWKRLLYSEGRM